MHQSSQHLQVRHLTSRPHWLRIPHLRSTINRKKSKGKETEGEETEGEPCVDVRLTLELGLRFMILNVVGGQSLPLWISSFYTANSVQIIEP